MPESYYEFIAIDLPPLLTAAAAAVTCALLGSFLLLRRQSLMGDAVAHAVLPGLVLGFMLGSGASEWAIFAGAAAAGMAAVLMIELLQRWGRVESGAALGVVFSLFFAAGVLLIERVAARNVDLDADCILHGQLESIIWFPPRAVDSFFSLKTLGELPPELLSSLVIMLLVAGLLKLFYKELQAAAFDSQHSDSIGFSAQWLYTLLMVLTAAAVVAAFRAVGSILVIGMLILPAATARLLTDRLSRQLQLSVLSGIVMVLLGYAAAALLPRWWGSPHALNAAGTMVVVGGLLLGVVVLVAPRYGVLGRQLRQWRLTLQVAQEDILGRLYRCEEQQLESKSWETAQRLSSLGRGGWWFLWLSLRGRGWLRRRGPQGQPWQLSERGRQRAAALVRKHRLWESYLVEDAGLLPEQVHELAHELEHVSAAGLEARYAGDEAPVKDPHGQLIPEKRN